MMQCDGLRPELESGLGGQCAAGDALGWGLRRSQGHAVGRMSGLSVVPQTSAVEGGPHITKVSSPDCPTETASDSGEEQPDAIVSAHEEECNIENTFKEPSTLPVADVDAIPTPTIPPDQLTVPPGPTKRIPRLDPNDPSVAFVRARGDAKLNAKLSGYMMNRVIEDKRVVVFATGQKSVNNAVKSIIASRRKQLQIKSNSDLGFKVMHQPGVNEDKITKFMIACETVNFLADQDTVNGKEEIYRADSMTDGRAVGLLIAEQVRSGKDMRIRAMGPRPVAASVVAHTWARKKLKEADLDCICFPEFKRFDLADKGERTLIEMRFKGVPYDPSKDIKQEWAPEPTW